jgi:hypothetical protein
VRDRDDRVPARTHDPCDLAHGLDGVVDQVESLAAEHETEGPVTERQRHGREDVRPAEVIVEVCTPDRPPRDQLQVRLGSAVQVEDGGGLLEDQPETRNQPTSQTREVQVVPLRDPGVRRSRLASSISSSDRRVRRSRVVGLGAKRRSCDGGVAFIVVGDAA